MSLDLPGRPGPPNESQGGDPPKSKCSRFERAWGTAKRLQIKDLLVGEPETIRGALFLELLKVEIELRRGNGEHPTAAQYVGEFPEYEPDIRALLDKTSALASKSNGRTGGARFKAGDMIGDRYRIVRLLGRGGMGEVYEVEDIELQKTYALKFLRLGQQTNPDERQGWIDRLKQEVMHAQSVSHLHVCQVHSYQEPDPEKGIELPFLVMPYASGGSLLALAKLQSNHRFAPETVTVYARQLCDALAAVHDAGILHRDLKPGNVLLDEHGRVKLADFGLAAMADQINPENAAEGTREYMAPEQLDRKTLDERTDIYALGLILYELVTGQQPFPAKLVTERREQQRTPPPAPSVLVPKLGRVFDRAIMRCLAHDPARRPSSAQEVKELLPPLTPEQNATLDPASELRPKVAMALLGAAVAGLLFHALLADWTMAYRQLPPAKDAGWLREHAVQVARSVGGENRGRVEHSGFEWDLDLVKDASRNRPEAWHQRPEARSPLVYFWYRSGPDHYPPNNRFAPTDPPLVAPGMECLLLDLDGNLIEYHAVPTRKPPPAVAGVRDELRAQHEEKLFVKAGLKRDEFHRSEVHSRPPVFAEDLWGLEELTGTGKWVDVAVCDGQVVYFRVGEPFSGRADRAQSENLEAQKQRRLAGGLVTIAIVLFAVTAGGLWAYRNWLQGHADVFGALRVLGLYAVLNTLTWVFITDHVRSLHVERVLLANSFGVTAFWGAVLFVCYLAVEPDMRRRWPERLSSWNSILRGNFHNPLVGWHVLIGVLAGTFIALPPKLAAPAFGTYYLLAPIYEPLTPNVPPGLLLALASYSLIRTAGAFVLLLLLGSLFSRLPGWVFRRERFATAVVVALLAAGAVQSTATFPEKSWLTWTVVLVASGMVVYTMVWYGWLATLVALFVSAVLHIMPLTLTPDPWYSTATLSAAAALLSLAAYGCIVSVGNQRFFATES